MNGILPTTCAGLRQNDAHIPTYLASCVAGATVGFPLLAFSVAGVYNTFFTSCPLLLDRRNVWSTSNVIYMAGTSLCIFVAGTIFGERPHCKRRTWSTSSSQSPSKGIWSPGSNPCNSGKLGGFSPALACSCACHLLIYNSASRKRMHPISGRNMRLLQGNSCNSPALYI